MDTLKNQPPKKLPGAPPKNDPMLASKKQALIDFLDPTNPCDQRLLRAFPLLSVTPLRIDDGERKEDKVPAEANDTFDGIVYDESSCNDVVSEDGSETNDGELIGANAMETVQQAFNENDKVLVTKGPVQWNAQVREVVWLTDGEEWAYR